MSLQSRLDNLNYIMFYYNINSPALDRAKQVFKLHNVLLQFEKIKVNDYEELDLNYIMFYYNPVPDYL